MMFEMENNLFFLGASALFAAVLWWLASFIKSESRRLIIRVCVVYFILPVPSMGHPLLFYQVWFLVLYYAINMMWDSLAVVILILSIFLVLAYMFFRIFGKGKRPQ